MDTTRTKTTFTPDQLTAAAYDFYTKYHGYFFTDSEGVYHYGAHEDGSLTTKCGTLKDVIAYLEHFTNTEDITTGDGTVITLDYEGQGFASKQFIEHLIRKHNLYNDVFSLLFLRKVLDYGLEYNRISKDGLAYWLIDLVPELEFNEVCGYYADECLTQNGQAAKRDYWTNRNDYIRKAQA